MLHQHQVALVVLDDSLLLITISKKNLTSDTRHFVSGISTATRLRLRLVEPHSQTTDSYMIVYIFTLIENHFKCLSMA